MWIGVWNDFFLGVVPIHDFAGHSLIHCDWDGHGASYTSFNFQHVEVSLHRHGKVSWDRNGYFHWNLNALVRFEQRQWLWKWDVHIPGLRDSYSSGRPLLDPEQLSEGTPSRLLRSTGVRRGPRSRTQSSLSSAEFLTVSDIRAGSKSTGDLFTAEGEGESATNATTPSGTADLSLSRPR